MALKRENECFLQREKKRQEEQREGRKNGWSFARWGTYKLWTKWGNAGALYTSASRWGSAQPTASQPPWGSSSLWHNLAQSGSGTVLFGLLTRMFTYTSQVILSPSVVFWGSKTNVDTPLSCDHPISQALTCFHKHLGKSPDLSQEDCLGGSAEPTASGTPAPDLTQWQGESTDSPQQTVGTRDCWVSQSLQFGDKPHTVWFISW